MTTPPLPDENVSPARSLGWVFVGLVTVASLTLLAVQASWSRQQVSARGLAGSSDESRNDSNSTTFAPTIANKPRHPVLPLRVWSGSRAESFQWAVTSRAKRTARGLE